MNSTGPHSTTGKAGQRLRSLLVFNRHRNIKSTQLAGKPSSRADLTVILIALLAAATIGVLVFTHLSERH